MAIYKNVILIILAAFVLFLITPGAAFADEGTGGMEVEVDGHLVRLVFPTLAKVGDNEFHIQITGPDGSPLSSTAVEITTQPIEKTDEHEAGMEEAPAPSSGHGAMNETGNEQPTAVPSGDMDGMSGMGSEEAVESIPDNSDSHAELETDVSASEPVAVVLEAGHEAGEYAGAITFAQSGHWMLVVHFTVNGETLEAEFPLEVATNIPASYGILAGFFGLNAFIIGTAAVVRRKPNAA
jgi:hypothetical protein